MSTHSSESSTKPQTLIGEWDYRQLNTLDLIFGSYCIVMLLATAWAWWFNMSSLLSLGIFLAFLLVNMIVSQISVRAKRPFVIEIGRAVVGTIIAPAAYLLTAPPFNLWWPGFLIMCLSGGISLGLLTGSPKFGRILVLYYTLLYFVAEAALPQPNWYDFLVTAGITAAVALAFAEVVSMLGQTLTRERKQHQQLILEKARSEHLLQQQAAEALLAERRQLESALRTVVEGTSAVTGRNFFNSLVQHLATVLQVRYALVAEVNDGQAHTLAFWDHDRISDNISYALRDTPCEHVVSQRQLCTYLSGVRVLFPADDILTQLNADSYMGFPMFNAAGDVLGHLVVMDDKSLTNEDRYANILQIFAARAGAELERQQAQTRLEASEAYFRSIIENATDGIAIAGQDGRFTYVSPSFARMLGYNVAELQDQPCAPLLHPEEINQAMNDYQFMVQNPGQPAISEGRLQHKNGEWRHIESSCVLLPSGEILGNYRDVTERTQLEEAARRAELRFHAVFEQPLLAVRIYAPDGRITEWNETTVRQLALNQEQVAQLAQTYNLLQDSEAKRLNYEDEILRAFRGEAVSFPPLRRMLPNGVLTWIQNFMYPVKDKNGRVTEVISLSQDVSAQVEAAETLKHLNEELEKRVEERTAELQLAHSEQRRLIEIIEATSDLVGTADINGNAIYFNQSGQKFIGWQQGDVGYKTLADIYPPHALAEVQQHIANTLLTGQKTVNFETFIYNAKAEEIPVSVVGIRHEEMDGNIFLSAIFRDISDHKWIEKELKQAKETAEAANKAKSTFLANMSHEIRTPMNAVIGMTSLLLNTTLNPKQQDFVETIRTSGDALLTVINDILDFSKIEAGKLDMESQPFDLRQCLESALDILANKASEKKIELAYEMAANVPAAIIGDVTRLRQILVNLIGNAIKFTEEGEVVVSIISEPITDHRLPITANQLHFSVRDTGIGIPPNKLDRLFQAFSQIDPSTTREYGGTGLGLAISKRLAELMGGNMWVESTGVGQGTTFHFTIAAETAVSPITPRWHNRQPALAGRRLLIVDDHATNRRILNLQTQSWGMIPVEADSPSAALALLNQGERFDLAILDVHMPDMDGVGLAAALCKLHRLSGRHFPLILLTSLGYETRPELEEVECFAAFLTKPVKPSPLYNVLVQALQSCCTDDEPTAETAESPITNLQIPQAPNLPPLRILLAEDVVVNQKFALLALEDMGYTADVVANGQEALQAIRQQPYDVILMDVQMPIMDGLEATRRIRNLAGLEDMPGFKQPYIIAMTANAMQGDREMCLEAGMNDYISKPVYLDELQAALVRVGQFAPVRVL